MPHYSGINSFGQLGIIDGDIIIRKWARVQLPRSFQVLKVVCRQGSTVFTGETDGVTSVFVCGLNDCGQLGVGHRHSLTTPSPVHQDSVIAVTVRHKTCFIHSRAMATGTDIEPEDRWYACGDNSHGQLCLGSARPFIVDPMLIDFNVEPGIEAITAQSQSTFIHMRDGTMFAAGNNDRGQLGIGHCRDVDWPCMVHLPPRARTVDVASGSGSTFFTVEDGTLLATGWNRRGQLGLGNRLDAVVPQHVLLSDVGRVLPGSVITGNCRTFIIDDRGRLYACGDNIAAFLFPDTDEHDQTRFMVTKPSRCTWSGLHASRIIVTQLGIFVQCSSGKWFSRGVNSNGELCQGHTGPVRSFMPLVLPPSIGRIVHIAPYLHSTFLIDENFKVYGVGLNDWHQLGIAHNMSPILAPERVVSPDAAIALGPAICQSRDIQLWLRPGDGKVAGDDETGGIETACDVCSSGEPVSSA